MNRKAFLALAILGIIFVSGCVQSSPKIVGGNSVVINTGGSGAPASPMDLTLTIAQFSADKTGEITVRIGKRTGYPAERFEAKNTRGEIQLPEGLQLIDGNLVWNGDIIGDTIVEFKVKVKAVKNGEWVVTAKALSNEFPGYDAVGDMESGYVLIKDGEVLISDNSFTPVNPGAEAERRSQ